MLNNLFLVDTSVWLFALRKDFIPTIRDRIDFLLRENAVITAGMVKLELLGGTRNESEFNRLKTRLDALETVESDDSLWEGAYRIAFDLRRKGLTLPYTDILIAACARKSGSAIVHADSHFDLIADHIGLKVESYVDVVRKS